MMNQIILLHLITHFIQRAAQAPETAEEASEVGMRVSLAAAGEMSQMLGLSIQ